MSELSPWTGSQRNLLVSIADIQALDPRADHGLNIYRRNLMAAASRALAISFPTVARLVGPSALKAMARDYYRSCGRDGFDWGAWGRSLPAWIQQQEALRRLPYLADCARLDWRLHCASRAADPVLNHSSFSLLETLAGFEFSLQFPPAASVVHSSFPIVTIFQAHQENPESPDLEHAATLLKQGRGETALIWRCGMQTRVRAVPMDEAPWVALMQGGTVEAQMKDTDTSTAMPFQNWLAQSIRQQLVIGMQIPKPINGGNTHESRR